MFINISIQNLSSNSIMAFMEFLVSNGASSSSVANHISAVKAIERNGVCKQSRGNTTNVETGGQKDFLF